MVPAETSQWIHFYVFIYAQPSLDFPVYSFYCLHYLHGLLSLYFIISKSDLISTFRLKHVLVCISAYFYSVLSILTRRDSCLIKRVSFVSLDNSGAVSGSVGLGFVLHLYSVLLSERRFRGQFELCGVFKLRIVY